MLLGAPEPLRILLEAVFGLDDLDAAVMGLEDVAVTGLDVPAVTGLDVALESTKVAVRGLDRDGVVPRDAILWAGLESDFFDSSGRGMPFKNSFLRRALFSTSNSSIRS